MKKGPGSQWNIEVLSSICECLTPEAARHHRAYTYRALRRSKGPRVARTLWKLARKADA